MIANLFENIPARRESEEVTVLLRSDDLRIARIVSQGHASPPGYWYDQDEDEWVIVLAGSARVWFEGESAARDLKPGDHVHIPAHRRHRVEWTDPAQATVWLAVHYPCHDGRVPKRPAQKRTPARGRGSA